MPCRGPAAPGPDRHTGPAAGVRVSGVVKVFAGGWGRWSAAAVSIAVSVAMFHAQGKDTPNGIPNAGPPAPGGDQTSAVANLVPPTVPVPSEAELLAASVPLAAQDFELELPRGVAPEEGLQVNTIWAARSISMMFLEIETIGGYRQDPLKWHPSGLALDVMIPNADTPEGIELGNQIAGYALANAKRWGVLHVIWRQGYYPGIGTPSWMADYGSLTANHFDHVHIATNGGGYPTGREIYYLGSVREQPPN